MEPSIGQKKDWKSVLPHPLLLLFIVIAFCAALSYVIPAGVFDRVVKDGRTIVVPGSFHYTDTPPASIFDIFRALPNGIASAIDIVILCLLVGGAVEIFMGTGALNVGLAKLLKRFGHKGDMLILVGLMCFYAVLGGFLGWIETSLPFVPIGIAVVTGMGFDAIVAVSVPLLGLIIPFAVGPFNIFTVGIAHQIAELPMFSGVGWRLFIFLVFTSITMGYVIRYAKKTKADPSLSLMKGLPPCDLKFETQEYENEPFSLKHKTILSLLLATMVWIIYGMLKLGWNMRDLTAAFVLSGVIAGIIAGMRPNEMTKLFLVGVGKFIIGGLVVGVARGVQWILVEGGISDTIIYGLSEPLKNLPSWLSAVGMFAAHTFINFFIPSGSGQAMATMPIMVPLADIIGVTRQVATQAFQFGDGISNIFWFTYGTLLIFLDFGKVPYERWIKFIWPLALTLLTLSVGFLVLLSQIGYGPF